MPWQLDLVDRLVGRAGMLDAVAELWLLGSAVAPETMDRWSDVDVGLVLTDDAELGRLLDPADQVWAMDRQQSGPRATCRLVLADGRRLDLVVTDRDDLAAAGGRLCYRSDRGPVSGLPERGLPEPLVGGTLTATPPVDSAVNEARFVATLAVVKHGRGDLLIGSHLVLELGQLCLVQAMLLRDRDEGTTSHRVGTGRDSSAAAVTEALASGTPVAAIRRLVQIFDRWHAELVPAYVSDWSALEHLIHGGP